MQRKGVKLYLLSILLEGSVQTGDHDYRSEQPFSYGSPHHSSLKDSRNRVGDGYRTTQYVTCKIEKAETVKETGRLSK
jgi:hypothetical protein